MKYLVRKTGHACRKFANSKSVLRFGLSQDLKPLSQADAAMRQFDTLEDRIPYHQWKPVAFKNSNLEEKNNPDCLTLHAGTTKPWPKSGPFSCNPHLFLAAWGSVPSSVGQEHLHLPDGPLQLFTTSPAFLAIALLPPTRQWYNTQVLA